MKNFVCILISIMFYGTSYGQIINVPDDKSTIQAAINTAQDGDTVLVADNTYFENIDFKGKAITVASHFIIDGDTSHIVNTIIDGSQPDHPDTASVVRFVSGEDTSSIIQGFTLTGGKGTYMPPLAQYKAGGGVFCYNSGAKILNNNIEYDSIMSDICSTGAGIYAWPPTGNAYIVVRNNRICNNYIYSVSANKSVQGAAIATDCHSIITGNVISNNESISENFVSMAVVFCRGSAPKKYLNFSNNEVSLNSCISNGNISTGVYGGGVYIVGDFGEVKNNLISSNVISTVANCSGPGMGVYNADSSLHIISNVISGNKMASGNSCTGGGIQLIFSTPQIINNLIYHNIASSGGGIGIYDTVLNIRLITNNTITENSAEYGGGLFTVMGNPVVLNSIIFNNDAAFGPEIFESGGIVTVNYSNVGGGWPGTGNIDIDPDFTDPENGDFHISSTSPCAASGNDVFVVNGFLYYCPAFDFEDDPRPIPLTAMPDMGADEVDESIIGFETLSYERLSFDIWCYPNPIKNRTTIMVSIDKTQEAMLVICDATGRNIVTLYTGKLKPGEHTFDWDAGEIPPGLYYCVLETSDPVFSVQTKKLIKLE